MPIPERFLHAIEVLEVKAGDHVLEIGCGAGLLAELIASELNSGKLVAMDRSGKMIRLAEKRNQSFLKKGMMELIQSELMEAELNQAFDKIVAVNVNIFWQRPDKALPAVRKLLKSDGILYLFYQAPESMGTRSLTPLEDKLETAGFRKVSSRFQKLSSGTSICLTARL